jgi:uncharacterized protein (TIGR03000 family)
MFATLALTFGSSAVEARGDGHGAGAGHALVGVGRVGGCGYGPHFRGYCAYPCWCGFGWGYGGWYDYPFYPYEIGFPVYVDSTYLPGLDAGLRPGLYASQGRAPVQPGSRTAAPVRLTDSDVLLSIRVPADAVVQINGAPTTQNGPRREFISSGLAPGRSYTFVVTARWTEPDGQATELEQRIHVQGGERRNVDFLTPHD